jgi:hypothetical protein
MRINPQPEAPERLAEDDSPFLSMADFFSLISLTVIYIIIAFSPQSPLTQNSFDVMTALASATGPASEIDNRVAYVSVLSFAPQLALRVVPAGRGQVRERLIAPRSPTDEHLEWLRTTLSSGTPPEKVVFYMGADDESGDAHRLFHELLKDTKRRFAVSLVFLEQDQAAP